MNIYIYTYWGRSREQEGRCGRKTRAVKKIDSFKSSCFLFKACVPGIVIDLAFFCKLLQVITMILRDRDASAFIYFMGRTLSSHRV